MRSIHVAVVAGLVGLASFPLTQFQATAQSRSTAAPPPTGQVTTTTGRTLTIPARVTRVADPWHANNGMVLMMGAADKIVATTLQAKKQPWFRKLFPGIEQVPAAFDEAGDVNIETLIGA